MAEVSYRHSLAYLSLVAKICAVLLLERQQKYAQLQHARFSSTSDIIVFNHKPYFSALVVNTKSHTTVYGTAHGADHVLSTKLYKHSLTAVNRTYILITENAK